MTTQSSSQLDTNQAERISTADILQVAKLSHLAIDETTAEHFADDIDKILAMMQTLSGVDTEGLMPLANVHEAAQKLRADIADDSIDRDANQAIAPAVQQGLYLVPQVIE
ncbi:Asp-tRNA(Asn)/Glu-tRNA(Gln) amidotransferase subunit GatC [Psychrobacter lutiphocae]|uniref:Asp-tRNA(Asn)/Glu-tRNA(Gln) amidotransferase subunit GatC n=1 Tax=Psychrobacter lutiphocae TaxID=540500 RepID=UPI0003734684|nr:Asp-tRNA(Asn)/Glu-tRNA(Gln) amidotransferase subunit GatC [Psychrobacter lutiphocae]